MATEVTLTRELRFGLHDDPPHSVHGGHGHGVGTNGFAGNPALHGIAPFLCLYATVRGEIDPATGMVINIKQVDQVLRRHAVPFLREGHYVQSKSPALAVKDLFKVLEGDFTKPRLAALRLAVSPFLCFAVYAEEPHMVDLTLRFEFSAAHRLHAEGLSDEANVEIFGRCHNANGHGHNYEVDVTVSGVPDRSTGQFIAIPELQAIVNEQVIDVFDHKHLNLDCAEFRKLNPTVENIAMVLFRKLKPHIHGPAKLKSLRVWETPKTVCEYSE